MTRYPISLALHVISITRIAMAGPNPNISNGTCYYDVNGESDPRYIPCGNAAVAYQSCCESQDMCLAGAACYNAQCENHLLPLWRFNY